MESSTVTLSHSPRVFISYAKEDVSVASEIRRLLTLANFDPWMDSSGLLAGDAWETRLVEVIRTSAFVVALLSEHTAGGYQQTELRISAQSAPSEQAADAPFVVPCLIGRLLRRPLNDAIPPFLGSDAVVPLYNVESDWRNLHEMLYKSARSRGLSVAPLLRSTPRRDVDEAAARHMIIQHNFFDSSRNKTGRAAASMLRLFENGGVVRDEITGREWTRRSGERFPCVGDVDARLAVSAVNAEKACGENDWRLPTLEEAMSIMSPTKNSWGLYVAPAISDGSYILTCDTQIDGRQSLVWIASYALGDCQQVPVDAPVPVRFVRTFWSHMS